MRFARFLVVRETASVVEETVVVSRCVFQCAENRSSATRKTASVVGETVVWSSCVFLRAEIRSSAVRETVLVPVCPDLLSGDMELARRWEEKKQ